MKRQVIDLKVPEWSQVCKLGQVPQVALNVHPGLCTHDRDQGPWHHCQRMLPCSPGLQCPGPALVRLVLPRLSQGALASVMNCRVPTQSRGPVTWR